MKTESKTIEQIAGRKIDVTHRGGKSFTFSFDGFDKTALTKLLDFFNGSANIEWVEDEEVGTFIYCDF